MDVLELIVIFYLPDRLKIIYDELSLLIDKYKPRGIWRLREIFFNKNAKTALKVGQARG